MHTKQLRAPVVLPQGVTAVLCLTTGRAARRGRGCSLGGLRRRCDASSQLRAAVFSKVPNVQRRCWPPVNFLVSLLVLLLKAAHGINGSRS